MVREGRVLISVAIDPDFGASYYVTAYEVGAQVTSGSASTTATVRAGHGFAANDKFIVGTDVTKYNTVTAVTSTTLTITAMSLSAGDLLVNLGPDTGITAPNYDGSGAIVYTDMDYSNIATNSTVQTDSNGRYRYFHKSITRWELIRSSLTAPIALYTDTGSVASTFNVSVWGAVGDGVADDSVAIQAALSAVTSSGGEVVFPAGVFLTSAQLHVKSNTMVRGAGIDATIVRRKSGSLSNGGTANSGGVFSTGPSAGNFYTIGSSGTSIGFRDLTADGNSSAFAAITDGNLNADGIKAKFVDGFSVIGCKSTNTLQDGIRVDSCNNVRVEGNIIKTTGQSVTAGISLNGVSIYNYSDSVLWGLHSSVSRNHISTSGYSGVAVSQAHHAAVIGNTITACKFGVEWTSFVASVVTSFYDFVVSGNTIHDLTAAVSAVGITVAPYTTHTVFSCSIHGNTIANVPCNGIDTSGVNGLSVIGNTVYGSNTESDAIYFTAIDLTVSANVTCNGNVVQFASAQNGSYGIRFLTVTGGVMAGNSVTNANGSATAANYLLNGTTQNALLSGNRSIGNKYGFNLGSSGTNSGNTIVNNYPTGALTSSYLDSSTQTNYLNALIVGRGSDTAATNVLTFDAATQDGTLTYDGSNKLMTAANIALKLVWAEFDTAFYLACNTGASVNSPRIRFLDNQASPVHLDLSKVGAYLAITNNAGTLNVFKFGDDGSFLITDGITAPATAAGFASIYVDTSDGDLKVKFGDGTVKTIVVDT